MHNPATDGAAWDDFYRQLGRAVLASRAPRDDDAYFQTGEHEFRAIADAFNVPTGGTLLEIGCGDGRMTRTFVNMYRKVYALDTAGTVLQACRRTLAGYSHVQFLHGGPEILDLMPAGSVDVVLSTAVFQHVGEAATILSYIEHAARLLTPDGAAVLQLRNPRRLTLVRDVLLDVVRTARNSPMPAFHPNYRGARITKADARGAADVDNRLRLVDWSPRGHHAWLVIHTTGRTA
jgi:SAM-dependent methyltransferase